MLRTVLVMVLTAGCVLVMVLAAGCVLVMVLAVGCQLKGNTRNTAVVAEPSPASDEDKYEKLAAELRNKITELQSAKTAYDRIVSDIETEKQELIRNLKAIGVKTNADLRDNRSAQGMAERLAIIENELSIYQKKRREYEELIETARYAQRTYGRLLVLKRAGITDEKLREVAATIRVADEKLSEAVPANLAPISPFQVESVLDRYMAGTAAPDRPNEDPPLPTSLPPRPPLPAPEPPNRRTIIEPARPPAIPLRPSGDRTTAIDFAHPTTIRFRPSMDGKTGLWYQAEEQVTLMIERQPPIVLQLHCYGNKCDVDTKAMILPSEGTYRYTITCTCKIWRWRSHEPLYVKGSGAGTITVRDGQAVTFTRDFEAGCGLDKYTIRLSEVR